MWVEEAVTVAVTLNWGQQGRWCQRSGKGGRCVSWGKWGKVLTLAVNIPDPRNRSLLSACCVLAVPALTPGGGR